MDEPPVESRVGGTIRTLTLDNGLTIVGEPDESFDSAAFNLLLPAGCCHDPADQEGLASLTCEMALRGAGPRDSRALLDDIDALGIDRSESVGVSQTVFSGCGVADKLTEGLAIFADIVRHAHLPEDQLEAGRLVCMQELRGIEDDPAQKVMIELRRQHYPSPWGLPGHGDAESLERLTSADVQDFYRRHYSPAGAILALAGGFDWDRVVESVTALLGDWRPAGERNEPTPHPAPRVRHVEYDSEQSHIGVAYDSIPYRHPDYFQAWASVGVLSGGSSSRLFTEVREKRGLCYTVSASLQSQKERAAVFCYAGTTSERAQETLDVTHAELVKLRRGVTEAELNRLLARIKSSLILQQESSSSRAASLARDMRHLGRARSLDELSRLVNAVTADSINRFLAEQPEPEFTIVTLGPEPLEAPRAVS